MGMTRNARVFEGATSVATGVAWNVDEEEVMSGNERFQKRMRRRVISVAVGLAAAAGAPAVFAQAHSCVAMQSINLPNVVITGVSEQPLPNAATPAAVYCQVDGFILTPGVNGEIGNQVKFRAALPEQGWNGKFLMEGNGAHAGVLPGFSALNRGYAEIGTDTGHTGVAFGNVSAGYDARWAAYSATRQLDFAYRAVHLTAQTGKQFVQAFYSQAPAHSYFNGCSLGGRQAWTEAQRYPTDFDGILAGDAFNNYNVAKMELNWNQQQQLRSSDTYVTQQKLINVGHATAAACDALDGLVDGLIDDPRKCSFDPATLQCPAGNSGSRCLTPGQVDTMKKLYQGARTSSGQQITPGFVPGGEDTAGTADTWLAASSPVVVNSNGTLSYGTTSASEFQSQDQFFTYLAWWPTIPNYDWRSFNFDTDPQKLTYSASTYSAIDTNLVPFMSNGGKLIAYHGWSDWAITPLLSIDYWSKVQAAMGDTSQYYRLFMVPGMGHCGGGPGPNSADYLTALEKWVENGQAPASIVATHTNSAGVADRTRPLCPYPQVARYKGTGSIDEAGNFSCVNPS